MAEEVKKTTPESLPRTSSEELVDSRDKRENDKNVAPANAKNGEAPKKFGAANNFSSESMARDNRGPRGPRQGGNNNNNNRGGGDRRDNRRGNNRRDDKPAEEKIFEEQTIAIDRVSRTVKGGRRLRFKALVVVGDKKARVGVGVAKGRDVQQAIEKATGVAKKNVITFPLNKTTIPHEVEVKATGAHVLLKPAAPGTGIIAGGVVRAIIGVTGISNLLSKSLGSTNKVNIAYATIKALESLVPKSEWIGAKPAKKPVKKEEK
jgi:small subunit ribosomal protein S5